jgi:hypothetical protein
VIVGDYIKGKECKMQKRYVIMTVSEEFLNKSVKVVNSVIYDLSFCSLYKTCPIAFVCFSFF